MDFSKGSTQEHNKIKKEFIVKVSEAFIDVMALPYDVGFFRAWSNPDIPVRCGQEGVPDILVLGNGFYLFFDVKTGNASFSKLQRAFRDAVTNINKGQVLVYKLKTIEEGIRIIEKARAYYVKAR